MICDFSKHNTDSTFYNISEIQKVQCFFEIKYFKEIFFVRIALMQNVIYDQMNYYTIFVCEITKENVIGKKIEEDNRNDRQNKRYRTVNDESNLYISAESANKADAIELVIDSIA